MSYSRSGPARAPERLLPIRSTLSDAGSSRLRFRVRCADGDDDPQGVGDGLGGGEAATGGGGGGGGGGEAGGPADGGGDGHQNVLNLLDLHPRLNRRTQM